MIKFVIKGDKLMRYRKEYSVPQIKMLNYRCSQDVFMLSGNEAGDNYFVDSFDDSEKFGKS